MNAIEQTEIDELLARAAEILVDRGWRQGYDYLDDPFEDPRASCCMMEAVDLAVSAKYALGTKQNHDVYGEVEQALYERLHFNPLTCSLVAWNDEKERTEGEILSLLRNERE
jgi:hypothetical protein